MLAMAPITSLSHRLLAVAGIAFCCLYLHGCERGVILQGKVADIQDEALPGVAVTVKGSGEQDLTDGVGEYELRCPPGKIELSLVKTGYTPGHISLEVAAPRHVEVTTTHLWRLPQDRGVYLFKLFRYERLTPTEPEKYQDENGKAVYGTKKVPELIVDVAEAPFFIAYSLPPYDIGLYRLDRRDVKKPAAHAPKETVWAPVESIAVLPAAIDEPEKLLLELQPTAPLEPAIYAFHWGALDGHDNVESRIFMFRVKGDTDETEEPLDDASAPEETPSEEESVEPDDVDEPDDGEAGW